MNLHNHPKHNLTSPLILNEFKLAKIHLSSKKKKKKIKRTLLSQNYKDLFKKANPDNNTSNRLKSLELHK